MSDPAIRGRNNKIDELTAQLESAEADLKRKTEALRRIESMAPYGSAIIREARAALTTQGEGD